MIDQGVLCNNTIFKSINIKWNGAKLRDFNKITLGLQASKTPNGMVPNHSLVETTKPSY